tara:strand:+ start:596 stop:1549 length:954 start_codon:yes stop_codon:yes gene_type:complete
MKLFIAGHKGMVGSALLKKLSETNAEIITAERSKLNLIDQQKVKNFFKEHSFDQVYLAAAKVGGIKANNLFPGEFLYKNLMIQSNVIQQSFSTGVEKLLFFGSSCIYPALSNQPIKEEQILDGKLEPSNEPYAIAKISGIKLCESYNRQYGTDYRCVMPTNLYGPGDNYHYENSHVIPGLLRRFHEAKVKNSKKVTVWGTGNPLREFLHVDDLAEASIKLMSIETKEYKSSVNPRVSHINIGSGEEVSIRKLAEIISEVVGFRGIIEWDETKPDGVPRKLIDSSKIFEIGWKPKYNLRKGLENTYDFFCSNIDMTRY